MEEDKKIRFGAVEIVFWLVSLVIPCADHAREHSDEQVALIADRIADDELPLPATWKPGKLRVELANLACDKEHLEAEA